MNNAKKMCAVFLVGCMIVTLAACGHTSTDNDSDKNNSYHENDVDSEMVSSTREDGLLFSTEYTIEDYVEDAIIVSKNNGLLYGLLDINGNEIIPVKYDDLDFLNKDDYIEGKCENVYLKAKYEDIYSVFDIMGNKVMDDSNKSVGYVNYRIKSESDNSSPFFSTKEDDGKIFYNEDGNECSRIYYTLKLFEEITFISNKLYMIYDKAKEGITIYNYEGSVVEKFDKYLYSQYTINNEHYMLVSSAKNEEYEKIKIDKNGNVSVEETYYSSDDLIAEEQVLKQEKKASESYYNLYETNSTWKLEDLDGNTLYDERYYGALKNRFGNDYLALLNENNQILLVSRTGKIYCNYGILETDDGGDTIRMSCGDSSKTVNQVFAGRCSIIIPVISSESGNYDIYYFKEK